MNLLCHEKKREEKWSSRYAYLCWFDELISDEKLDLKKKKKKKATVYCFLDMEKAYGGTPDS